MVSRSKQEGMPPGSLPSVAPPVTPSSVDYSLATLQTVMEMQKTLGGLTQAVATLMEQQKEQSHKTEEQGKKIEKVGRQIYAFVIVVIVLWALFSFFSKFANDWLFRRTEAPQVQQQSPDHK